MAVAKARRHPFRQVVFVTDAHAACVGAHGGKPGGVIVVGTGTIGWAKLNGNERRVGGYGLPLSDEGSGAWIGCEALRRVLWAHDGRISWTNLLTVLFNRFGGDCEAVVRFSSAALPRDFGVFAPIVVAYAKEGDAAGIELMQAAGRHIDQLAARLVMLGTRKLALVGGLAPAIQDWISPATRAGWCRQPAMLLMALSRWHVPPRKQLLHKQATATEKNDERQPGRIVDGDARGAGGGPSASVAVERTASRFDRTVPADIPARSRDVRPRQFCPRRYIRQAHNRAIPRNPGRRGRAEHCLGLSPISSVEGPTRSHHLAIRAER